MSANWRCAAGSSPRSQGDEPPRVLGHGRGHHGGDPHVLAPEVQAIRVEGRTPNSPRARRRRHCRRPQGAWPQPRRSVGVRRQPRPWRSQALRVAQKRCTRACSGRTPIGAATGGVAQDVWQAVCRPWPAPPTKTSRSLCRCRLHRKIRCIDAPFRRKESFSETSPTPPLPPVRVNPNSTHEHKRPVHHPRALRGPAPPGSDPDAAGCAHQGRISGGPRRRSPPGVAGRDRPADPAGADRQSVGRYETLYVTCHSGARARRAAQRLAEAGYHNHDFPSILRPQLIHFFTSMSSVRLGTQTTATASCCGIGSSRATPC